MFFHSRNFEKFIPDSQDRITAAKVANDIIAEKGKVMFGRIYSNGQADGFTTTKESTDTHVGILIGAQEMAAFAPENTYVQRETTTNNDLLNAQKKQIEILEARLVQHDRINKGPVI